MVRQRRQAQQPGCIARGPRHRRGRSGPDRRRSTVASEHSQERADLITRQFKQHQAWYEAQGIGRRDFLRLIAKGTAAATVFPALLATGAVSPKEVLAASQPDPAPRPGAPAAQSSNVIVIGTLGEAQTINP